MDELGKSFPAAEGMVDAEQSTRGRHHNEVCLNCGTKLLDVYCHRCGQKDIPRRQTLGELFSNFISSFWSYEGKFFLTTKYLITRPGFLASEYNAGHREGYYHPARMYVFVSFLFFLLFFSLPDGTQGVVKMQLNDEDMKELQKAGLDSTFEYQDSTWKKSLPLFVRDSLKKEQTKAGKGARFSLSQSDYKNLKEYDSAQNAFPENKRDGWFKRRMTIRGIELNAKYKDNLEQLGEDFKASFSDNFSKILFYLLPLFALLLKVLYIRRDFYYSEHLVLSIYYYNFFYLAAALMLLINLVPGIGFVATILGFWIYFYLLFAMKRLYQQSWGRTILKFVIFSFVFSFLVVIGIAINAMVTLMII